LWRGRLAAAEGFLSGISFCRSLHCWRFVGFGFLAGCPVRFCCAVVGRFFAVRFRSVGFGLSTVTVGRNGFLFWAGWLAGLHSVFYGCLLGFSGWWLAVLAGSSWFQSGVVGLAGLVSFPLCGSAVQWAVRVRTKRHPHAQQASQRDCPPFRLAKLVFYQR